MTAEEMFKELGFRPDPFNCIGNILKYFYEIKYNSNARYIVEFDCNDDGYYMYYYQVKDPLNNNNVILEKQARVTVDLHKAITKKMEELGWI
jgi:hypothetical protein